MLYHAYRQKYMDVTGGFICRSSARHESDRFSLVSVGPESSTQLRDVLHTSCASGFCIGEYLGALGSQYPQREVEVQFAAKKAPILVFVENRARFRLHGKMNLYVRPANATQVKVRVRARARRRRRLDSRRLFRS